MRKKKTTTVRGGSKKRKLKDTDAQKKPKKSWNSQPVFPAVIADLKEREQTGIKTYGQSLHTNNGRDVLKDLYQEILDAAVYLKQRLMEEAAGDFLPITDWDTPATASSSGGILEARPASHFPAPIVPPVTVASLDYPPQPGRIIPVAGDPSQVCGRPWTTQVVEFFASPFVLKKESVLEEAERIVNGPRADSYGHPFDDFSRTAGMITALLGKRLDGPLTPEDVAKIMICVKLSRETNKPGRDNRVDGAGYFGCLDKVVVERARREVR